ncbi:hemolysin family protein [Nocardioides sp.]|uniref:hemolysin family protein n=1 Tax=Nocardioides sp. TaxID=35761 RepID=UPI0039E68D4B
MSDWLMIAVGLVLTVGTGVFVAAEFALVNLDRHDLETRREHGERRLTPTITALRHTSTQLSSAQLGITLTTLLTGYTFEPAVSALLESPLEAAGVPDGAVPGIGAVVGVLLATLFSMVIGELVPKNFALAVPLATAKLVVPLQLGFTTLFRPIVALLNNTANAVIRGFGIEPKEELSGARTAEELTYLIRHSADEGALEAEDATLLDRTLRFASLDAGDVMTPRVRMATVRLDDTAEEVIAVSSRTGFSRLPVLDDGPDDIAGFVHVKQAFAVPYDDRGSVTAGELMTEPLRVPETMSAERLLTELRSGGLQIAVVADEYGGTAGVVTLEDLVEEIVGELQDEHDRFRVGLTRTGRSITFDATWRPDELLERTGVAVPDDGDWDTVGGYLTAQLDRIPEVGDEVELPAGSLRVDRVHGPHASRLQFIPAEAGDS